MGGARARARARAGTCLWRTRQGSGCHPSRLPPLNDPYLTSSTHPIDAPLYRMRHPDTNEQPQPICQSPIAPRPQKPQIPKPKIPHSSPNPKTRAATQFPPEHGVWHYLRGISSNPPGGARRAVYSRHSAPRPARHVRHGAPSLLEARTFVSRGGRNRNQRHDGKDSATDANADADARDGHVPAPHIEVVEQRSGGSGARAHAVEGALGEVCAESCGRRPGGGLPSTRLSRPPNTRRLRRRRSRRRRRRRRYHS